MGLSMIAHNPAAAIAMMRSEDIAGDAFGVNANQGRRFRRNRAHRERNMFASVHVGIDRDVEVTVARLQLTARRQQNE